jgi:hypothetical protein
MKLFRRIFVSVAYKVGKVFFRNKFALDRKGVFKSELSIEEDFRRDDRYS